MKAVLVRETGGAEALEYGEAPDPEPGEGQRLVEVRAAAVNFADLMVRKGVYPGPPPLPAILGNEVAGEVDGRRVIGLSMGGGYAERVAVDEEWLFDLPGAASFEEGAGFLVAFLSAYLPLTRQARVAPGDTVLVHAAAGGVGSAAVQVSLHLGAHVVATAGTEERRRIVLELGAAEAYSYEEFADHVRPDVIVDPVGGDVFARSIPTLRSLGTIVAVGSAGGGWQDVSPTLLVGRNIAVAGIWLARLIAQEPRVVQKAARELLELWDGGALRPVVVDRFALEDAASAHRLIEGRRQTGKVILVP